MKTKLFTRLFNTFFKKGSDKKKSDQREVLLIKYDQDVIIRIAYPSDCGWIAKCFKNTEDSWCILLPDGRTKGYNLVKNWLPHKGWKKEDFDEQFFNAIEL